MKHLLGFLSFVFGLIFFILLVGYEVRYTDSIESEIPIVLPDTKQYTLAMYELLGADVLSVIFIILSLIVFTSCLSARHRLCNKKPDSLCKEDIKQPFILYLRSFAVDKTTRKKVSPFDLRSEEEILVNVLKDIAPVYAIGDPKDKKMPIGASRLYVDDKTWKSTVEYLADRAIMVVLRLGSTDSFWWEVEMTLNHIPLEKILFVVPENKNFKTISILYKTLLSHHIDISKADLSIERKHQGSISSFLFFDSQGTPQTRIINIPPFTKLVYSYESILRVTLSDYFCTFGLQQKQQKQFHRARCLQMFAIFFILFIAGAKTFGDIAHMKYQLPEEIVNEAILCPAFVTKYSSEINATNLYYAALEARKGFIMLDDKDVLYMLDVELKAYKQMDHDEFVQSQQRSKGLLLMIKKYCSSDYQNYVNIIYKALRFALEEPQLVTETYTRYLNTIDDDVPMWLESFFNFCEIEEDSYKLEETWINLIQEHYNDVDFVQTWRIMMTCMLYESLHNAE